jgi:hypothetical protein
MFEHSASWFQWLIRVNQDSRKRNLPKTHPNDDRVYTSYQTLTRQPRGNKSKNKRRIQWISRKSKETRQQPQRTERSGNKKDREDVRVLSEHRCRSCTKTHKASTKPKLENESFKSSLVRQQVSQATHSHSTPVIVSGLRNRNSAAPPREIAKVQKRIRFNNNNYKSISAEQRWKTWESGCRRSAQVCFVQRRERWRCEEHKSLQIFRTECITGRISMDTRVRVTMASYWSLFMALLSFKLPILSREILELGI